MLEPTRMVAITDSYVQRRFPKCWPAFVQRSHSHLHLLRLPSFLSGGVAKFRLRITAAQPKNYVLVFQANGAESGKSVCAAVDGCNLRRYRNSQMPTAVATCGAPEHL